MTKPNLPGRGRGQGQAIRVEFLIDGDLSDVVLANFPELAVTRGPAGGSLLYGTAADQAHLDGLLARFSELGIPVVEFRQVPG